MVKNVKQKTYDHFAAPPQATKQAAPAVAAPHRPAPPEGAEVLWDERETAAALTVQPGTLNIWRTKKRYDLPFIRVGRAVRYRKSDVLAFIERPAGDAVSDLSDRSNIFAGALEKAGLFDQEPNLARSLTREQWRVILIHRANCAADRAPATVTAVLSHVEKQLLRERQGCAEFKPAGLEKR